MKRFFSIWAGNAFLILSFLFYACREKEQAAADTQRPAVKPPSSYATVLNLDSFRMAVKNEVREEERIKLFTHVDTGDNPYILGGVLKTTFIFSEHAKIYALPDTASKVEAVLPFATQVIFVEGVRKSDIKGVSWIKIRHPRDNNATAYLKREDLADYCTYVYGSESGFLVNETGAMNEEFGRTAVEIRRYKKDVDTVIERYQTISKYGGYRFRSDEARYTTLKTGLSGKDKKYDHLFVYETFTMSCPGATRKEFIVDDGLKLTRVLSVSAEGEGGYFDHETAYIPMKFGNGKILLVADADVGTIFNAETAELNAIPYSEQYEVPVENLVIVKHEDNGYNTNADFDVEPEKVKVNTKLTIYEWNGKKLNKIKEL